MAAILESPPHALSIADLARISQRLADEVSRLPLRSEGFSVADYLSLDGNYLVEYVDGCLQVLPMPDLFHQALTIVLVRLLDTWAEASDPAACTAQAPFRMYLSDRLYREPDVALMLGRHAARMQRTRWDGADLAIEIISDTNRDHDVTTKRADYAAAGIPEYWIVDPEPKTVRVLTLPAGASAYVVDADYGPGTLLSSKLLPGFNMNLASLFAAAERRLGA